MHLTTSSWFCCQSEIESLQQWSLMLTKWFFEGMAAADHVTRNFAHPSPSPLTVPRFPQQNSSLLTQISFCESFYMFSSLPAFLLNWAFERWWNRTKPDNRNGIRSSGMRNTERWCFALPALVIFNLQELLWRGGEIIRSVSREMCLCNFGTVSGRWSLLWSQSERADENGVCLSSKTKSY